MDGLAIIRGVPLEDEPGLGALTLPGFLAEVCERYGEREALVMFEGDAATARWTYAELWERSSDVARANTVTPADPALLFFSSDRKSVV